MINKLTSKLTASLETAVKKKEDNNTHSPKQLLPRCTLSNNGRGVGGA